MTIRDAKGNHVQSTRVLFIDGLYLAAPTVPLAQLAMYVCQDDERHRNEGNTSRRWPSGLRLGREECGCTPAHVRE